ncbi:MAG: GNAT family N-acetyltransferase [Acidimicrobiia bacterium]|nr:GNAT family N-acetyltransferase [Acidimicrobiia bacterium]
MEVSPDPVYTGRYVLRPFRRRDVDALNDAVRTSITELHEWLPWAHLAYGRTEAAHFIRESMKAWRETRAYDYGVRGRDEGSSVHLGNVSIWFVSRGFRTGEIGYWVRSDQSAKGIATEVTARLVQIGFDQLKMHRIVLRIAVGNRPSERVAEKLHFTREGILREELKVRGKWLDHTVYSMLDHEYDKHRAIIAEIVDGVGLPIEDA